MQLPLRKSRLTQAFSLIEVLVVVAVIGVIAGIGLSSVSNVNESAKTARDQSNAQSFSSMFNGAKAGGAAFASNTKEGIFDELVAGVESPTNGIDFQFSPLDADQKAAALAYCEYDPVADVMAYSSEPIVAAAAPDPDPAPAPDPTPDPDPAPPAAPVYGPWTNFQVVYNSQLVGRLNDLRASDPSKEWQWVPTDPYIHNQSQIQFRTVD